MQTDKAKGKILDNEVIIFATKLYNIVCVVEDRCEAKALDNLHTEMLMDFDPDFTTGH